MSARARSPLQAVGPGHRLVLFVAGEEPNSRIARANLDRVLSSEAAGEIDVEVVDVLQDSSLALKHQVLVTPALLQLRPEPRILVIGNLSETDTVRAALGLALEQEAAR
jgi:circadian clock protein KaiB